MVARLKWNVLFKVLALDHIFVVKFQTLTSAQNVDLFSVCEIAKSARKADRLKHRSGSGKRILARSSDFTVHIVFLAQNLLHGYGDKRFHNQLGQSRREVLAQPRRPLAHPPVCHRPAVM